MKPNRGFAKDIYEIVEENGPVAYGGIHKRLRERKIRVSSKQVKKSLSNMVHRNNLARADHCSNKFVVANPKTHQKPAFELELTPTPTQVEKTPERDEITPPRGLFNIDLAILAVIAVITSALTTIVMRSL